MEYVEAAEARSMPGMRLVVSKGAWAVWSECAKNILHVKGIPFTAVAQYTWQDNPDLVAWTGHRNQPQAVWNDEPARTSWIDILNLAEKLAPEPALIPADAESRAKMFGLANELCGENGFGWNRRIMSVTPGGASGAGAPTDSSDRARILSQSYGASQDAAAIAPARVADIVGLLVRTLKEQQAKGSRYLVGDKLSAVDIYWACFSNLIEPVAPPNNPMEEKWRVYMADIGPVVAKAVDPILIEHRDYIYENYLIFPIDF
jgi:glutathione S-transferase